MFSRFTQRGVEATVQALTLGADDYVPKPGDGLDVGPCIEGLLIPKIKLLGQRARPAPAASGRAFLPTPSVPPQPSALPARAREQRVEIVVLGASTGGPNALAAIFPAFPPGWPVPVLIVQHMPPVFTARLAERLSEKSPLRVREGQAGEPVSAAPAWVAPGDHHMLCCREGKAVLPALNQAPPAHSCRPSV